MYHHGPDDRFPTRQAGASGDCAQLHRTFRWSLAVVTRCNDQRSTGSSVRFTPFEGLITHKFLSIGDSRSVLAHSIAAPHSCGSAETYAIENFGTDNCEVAEIHRTARD